MENDKIVVIDENGVEIEMEVLFTFDSEEYSKQYVLYYNPNEEEGTVYASSYTEDGQLIPIDDEAEWEMIDEVFATFVEGEHEHDENCGCGHHHHHDGESCGCGHHHDE